MIEIFQLAILGLVQGISEFLPISSSAHLLILAKILLNQDLGITIVNILQIGTLIAVYQYFWADIQNYLLRILQLIQKPKLWPEFKKNILIWRENKLEQNDMQSESQTKTDIQIIQLIIATIPIVFFGGLYSFFNFDEYLKSNFVLVTFLILGSFLMLFSEIKYSSKTAKSNLFNLKEVVILGLFQSLALLSGMSRSGSTISGALILNHDRKQAVRFSFLMSLPAITLAGILAMIELIIEIQNSSISWLPNTNTDTNQISILALAFGFLASYIFGYLSLKWLLKYLSNNTFKYFIIYRLILATAILAFLIGF